MSKALVRAGQRGRAASGVSTWPDTSSARAPRLHQRGLANADGRSPLKYFLVSLFLGPVVTIGTSGGNVA
jgi:hypothetical protein